MQYNYIECDLPSNGKLYPTRKVHLRPKTIFDIKSLLNNPIFLIKSEIDTLQNCIDPRDNVDVYNLVNQDVVFLLYKLRSMSDDSLTLILKNNQQHVIKISELEVKYLDKWDNVFTLPESKYEVKLTYKPLSLVFNIEEKKEEFLEKYPEYQGDVYNAVTLLNIVESLDGSVNKDLIRVKLESLSWKDSLYLINKIEELDKLDFGIQEETKVEIDGKKIKIPIQISEEFFRPTL